MVDDSRQRILDRVRDALAAQADVRVAIAFGSSAVGDAGPDSDSDIAVLGTRALDAARRRELIRLVADITGRPVDLVDLRTAGVPLLRSVLRHGRQLVRNDRSAYDQLVTRMLVDAEDFLPYRERMLRERRAAWIR